MSLQNLLEMDDLNNSQSYGANGGNKAPSPKALPRPLPRSSRIPKLGATGRSSTFVKEPRAIDDVISFSSEMETTPSPTKQTKRTVAFTTTQSFDNNAFVQDEGPSFSPKPPKPRLRPVPLERQSQQRKDSLDGGNSSWFSSEKREDPHKSSIDKLNDNLLLDDEDDDEEGNHSSATFTIENEKPSSKKPPIPKPVKRRQRSVTIGESTTSADEPSYPDDNSDDNEKPGPPSKPTRKKTKDYSAIEIEQENPDKPSNDNNDNPDNDKRSEGGISAAADDKPAKQSATKKSRFGKLFSTSLSSDTKNKNKSVSDTADKSGGGSVDEGGASDQLSGGKESKQSSSIVSRWKKSFVRSSSSKHAVPEEEEETEEVERKEVGSIGSGGAQKKETRIFMPEDSEENSEDEVDDKENTNKKGKSKKESEATSSGKDDEKKKAPSKLKPFAKLIISKNKENRSPRKEEDAKALDTKKGKKGNEPEVVKGKQKKKEEDDKRRPPDEFSASSLSSSQSSEEEEQEEPEVKSKSSLKKKGSRKSKKEKREMIPVVDSASGKDLLFGVTVHSSDLLPLDPNVIHPVIKVTVMFQDGEYMRRSTETRGENEEEEDDKRRSDKKSKRHSRKLKASDSKAPSTSTQTDAVLPIMSQPCRARHSIPTFAPTWNELLVFEEPFKRFAVVPNQQQEDEEDLSLDPILFFEVMDFLPMPNNSNSNSTTTLVTGTGFHGTDLGWYKIAWAFLKPLGANGATNLNRKLRLQLYKPVKLRKREKVPDRPEVYSWWKSGRREKINNCTLYVTPKGITPPETTKSASLRQLLSMRKEQLTQAILDSQLAPTSGGKRKGGRDKQSSSHNDNLQSDFQAWTRMEGQSCKPPNKLVASLPSSQMESLNIVISGNVHATKFSPCGNLLACGLGTDELHVILLFKVPSWTLLKTLKGHHGLIYDITWSIFQLENEFQDNSEQNLSSSSQYHYLASASADSTVRVWKMKNCDEKRLLLYKVLYHPSYVYSVKFHPTHVGLVATGCFDFVIRIWDLRPDDHEEEVTPKGKKRRGSFKGITGGGTSEASPIILLDKHSSFVNCLLFDNLGQHLFSGDGSACIFKWSCVSPTKKKSWRLEKDVKLHSANVPVNSLDLHPSGTRLLVHLRDNFLKILDVVTLIPLQSFSGLHNERLQIRSCFSPCGNLVLSGSEDSTLCVWDADTGKILQLNSPQNHPNCVVSTVDYHPFDYYVAVGLTSAISEPSPVLIYFYQGQSTTGRAAGMMINYPVMLKRTAMKMRKSLEKSRSQSSYETGVDTGGGRQRGPPKRGDSTEKFISIIHKLDTALYFAQQRNKRRQSEAQSSTCLTAGPTEMESKENLETGSRQSEQPIKYVKKKQLPDRPRSASQAGARARRDRYRKSVKDPDGEREAKSDSEQAYQVRKSDPYKDEEETTGGVVQIISAPKPLKRRTIPVQKQHDQRTNGDNIENHNTNPLGDISHEY